VRSNIVKDFNGYAGGKPFFGEKRMPLRAEPGTYNLELKAGEDQVTGEITIRPDPILKD
jgi:hypothetical protein